MIRLCTFLLLVLAMLDANLSATIFGSLRGIIHDPQHRPVNGAQVTICAEQSDWTQTIETSYVGEFGFDAVPVGRYVLTVTAPGFMPLKKTVTLTSGSVLKLHYALAVGPMRQTVEVSEAQDIVNPDSSTTASVISRRQIAAAPGADQTNSMAMITDYVPGAYMVHDQLHLRGGHQVTWLLDGVPVPNTNIASNVGPQFDPKDIDYVEVQRGGYTAEYGDRAYGVFNVVTRSGFERNNEGELVASYGNFNNTDNQLSFGSHTDRFAYYGSFSGNRTDLGLEAPSTKVLHDMASGVSGFGSLIFNKTPSDQLRLVASVRGDQYQVPNTPEQQLDGIRDVEKERDALVNFSWVHRGKNGILLTVSPFYHFNRAHYIGGQTDTPVIPEDDRGSTYAGGVANLSLVKGKHNAQLGLQGFGQHDNVLLRLDSFAPIASFRQRAVLWGSVGALFLQDQFKATNWLALNGGVRLTHFSGSISENAADPRIGAAIRLPRLRWVFHGFYGRYYQPPPLLTASGPILELAARQGFGFLPLRGERDEQHEFGISIPISGWVAELNQFRTAAQNFFDHDVLGNSNIFFPVTIDRARIHGWEATLLSPKLAGTTIVQLAYSRQVVQGRGGITGGLTDFQPPEDNGYYFLDHDQRHTLSTIVRVDLPWRSHIAGTISYGSGFLNGDGPSHLPSHTTLDFSVGKSFAEKLSVQFTALNATNRRFLLDNSNSFGGTHFAHSRQISLQMRYRFHY